MHAPLASSARAALCFGLFLSACAGDSGNAPPGATLHIAFRVEKSDQLVPCATAPEISKVQVLAFTGDGLTLRNGYPQAVDCGQGTVDIVLPSGDSVVEMRGLGVLDGMTDSVLYRARTPVSFPAVSVLELALKPEVAFLAVAWSFPNDDLSVCAGQVDSVEVVVSAGSGQAPAFRDTFACDGSPIVVPVPLRPDRFTIHADAYSSAGGVVYAGTASMMVLERGDNLVTVALAPSGGRLLLDWEFDVGSPAPVRMCDLAGVSAMTATVRSVEGGPAATDQLDCATARPYAFTASRFPQGRHLIVSIAGESASARFLGVENVDMPDGDRYPANPLLLERVGTATVSMTVRSSTCAAQPADAFHLRLLRRYPGGDTMVYDQQVPGPEVSIADLAYATYLVQVEPIAGGAPLCMVQGEHIVDGRLVRWDVDL